MRTILFSEVERGRARPLMKKRLLQKASSGLPLSAHEKKGRRFSRAPTDTGRVSYGAAGEVTVGAPSSVEYVPRYGI